MCSSLPDLVHQRPATPHRGRHSTTSELIAKVLGQSVGIRATCENDTREPYPAQLNMGVQIVAHVNVVPLFRWLLYQVNLAGTTQCIGKFQPDGDDVSVWDLGFILGAAVKNFRLLRYP